MDDQTGDSGITVVNLVDAAGCDVGHKKEGTNTGYGETAREPMEDHAMSQKDGKGRKKSERSNSKNCRKGSDGKNDGKVVYEDQEDGSDSAEKKGHNGGGGLDGNDGGHEEEQGKKDVVVQHGGVAAGNTKRREDVGDDSSSGKSVTAACGKGSAGTKIRKQRKSGRKGKDDKELEKKELTNDLTEIMNEGNFSTNDIIEALNKLKADREVSNVRGTNFQEELNRDVGEYNLCDEKDTNFATPRMIKENWEKYQTIGTALKRYLTETTFQKYGSSRQGARMSTYMKAFMDSIARVYVVRDDPSAVQKLCGTAYKWRMDFSVGLSKEGTGIDGVTMGMIYAMHLHEECQKQMNNSNSGLEDYCAMPKGMKYVLELQDENGKYGDWIYVARSNFEIGHLGLFAARQFDAGTFPNFP